MRGLRSEDSYRWGRGTDLNQRKPCNHQEREGHDYREYGQNHRRALNAALPGQGPGNPERPVRIISGGGGKPNEIAKPAGPPQVRRHTEKQGDQQGHPNPGEYGEGKYVRLPRPVNLEDEERDRQPAASSAERHAAQIFPCGNLQIGVAEGKTLPRHLRGLQRNGTRLVVQLLGSQIQSSLAATL